MKIQRLCNLAHSGARLHLSLFEEGRAEREKIYFGALFYFRVNLCEERQFIAFIFKIPGPSFSGALKGSAVGSEDKGKGLVATQGGTVREEGACAEAEASLV